MARKISLIPATDIRRITDRTFDQVYQNSTGKLAYEYVTVAIELTATNGYGAASVLVDDTNPPGDTEILGSTGIWNGVLGAIAYLQLNFIVPPGWYYKLYKLQSSSNIGVVRWMEAY